MPTFGVSSVSWKWHRSATKLFRGSTFLLGIGRDRRKWRVVDRQFDKRSQLYEHQIVPA